MITPEEYENKRQARIQRLKARAERARQKSDDEYEAAHKMASAIPFGQPILVGHYSEKSDRRYRQRMANHMDKSVAAIKEAKYWDDRVDAAEKNTDISSDDPQAVEKLNDKIARLEKRQEMMKAANKLVRKGDRQGLVDIGFSDTVIYDLFQPDYMGRIGFPEYALKNNNANIRRLKERAALLEKRQLEETTEETINGIRMVDNVDENRLQLFFPGKPNKEIRDQLKSHGFHWSPSNGCWQAFRGNNAQYWANLIIEKT